MESTIYKQNKGLVLLIVLFNIANYIINRFLMEYSTKKQQYLFDEQQL